MDDDNENDMDDDNENDMDVDLFDDNFFEELSMNTNTNYDFFIKMKINDILYIKDIDKYSLYNISNIILYKIMSIHCF